MSLLPFLTAPGRLSAMLHPGMRLASSNAAQVMNGGAKPPVGTPPFSPPYPNTGGAEPPNRKGLAGFIDRVFNPTNALGQFGQALVCKRVRTLPGSTPCTRPPPITDPDHPVTEHQPDRGKLLAHLSVSDVHVDL